ncbi:MAG: hypothetical protein IBJ00_05815 [Alphaproteobacteria bacterium]|nr:hypothetical protein [Alphaproteobacteria bacterium]
MSVYSKLSAMIFTCICYEGLNASMESGSTEEERGKPSPSRRMEPSLTSASHSSSSKNSVNDGPAILQRAIASLPEVYGSASKRGLRNGWVNVGGEISEELDVGSDKIEKHHLKIDELLEAQKKQLQEEYKQQLEANNESWKLYANKKKEKARKAVLEKSKIEENMDQLRLEAELLRVQLQEAQRINVTLEAEKHKLAQSPVNFTLYQFSSRKTAASPGFTYWGDIRLDDDGYKLLTTFSLAPGIRLVKKDK